jgi:hypothetical protein
MTENRTKIVYAGYRKGKKNFYFYINTETKRELLFTKKLVGYETIGCVLEVTETDDGVKTPYKYVGKLEKESDLYEKITEWSIQERTALQEKRMQSEAKKKHSETIEELVGQIKTASWHMKKNEKANLALWIYNEILK